MGKTISFVLLLIDDWRRLRREWQPVSHLLMEKGAVGESQPRRVKHLMVDQSVTADSREGGRHPKGLLSLECRLT